MFQFETGESFPDRELKILKFWKEKKIFEKSVEDKRERQLFNFYDGPPFATGLPHYGHLLAGTIKDVVPRYKTMKGFCVPRRFGWDCHGLPIENEIEKGKELSGAASIEAFGIGNFNEECRGIVLRYTEEWKKTVDRMGRWVNFDETYRTMDLSFMESVWWVCKELFQKGLIYEGFKVMPFSTKLGTPLSNFEANLNYKDVDDPSVTIAFQSVDDPNLFFLAWTTTPWTLPSNLALIAGPKVRYVKVKDPQTERFYVLAEDRVSHHFKEEVEIVEKIDAKSLEGKKYHPLFPFFAKQEGAFKIVLDDFVSTDEGTGIVHAAPAFGEMDFYVCKRERIEPVIPVDANGRFTEEVLPYAGTLVKEADLQIIRDLKKMGKVFSQATIRHRYPFCWRSDTPLIYKAVSTWFVAVEQIKDKIIQANEEIYWVPNHIKHGRFGKWLENARDWAISRNRYWGTPIPIWRSDDGDLEVIGSIEELEKLTKAKIHDLHRHHIDSLTFEKNGKIFKRVPEVFDCWFESGSMPYAQLHYPFENKKEFEAGFPADFIGEGLDQTRGWFYTLTVLSAALFNRPAFKNVIVNGIILAEDGNKMSKRLRNYPDPEKMVNQFGADAVRLYMLGSPAVHAEDLRFSEKGVEQILRQALIPLWNSFVFLSTYAKIYHWTPKKLLKSENLIDRWILSRLQRLIIEVENGMEKYELSSAVSPFVDFIDQLTNWYIRRSRDRFWADEDSLSRQEAFSTLYTVLLTISKVAAPFVPFIAEAIYLELRHGDMAQSVHLEDFPIADFSLRDEILEKEMQGAQLAVSLGHSLRKEQKLKVRQPLAKAHLITATEDLLDALKRQKDLIADELNVKEIEFHADESKFVKWFAKPNFPVLGKKIGKKMPAAQKVILEFGKKEINFLRTGNNVSILVDGEEVMIEPEDVSVERKVLDGLVAANEMDLTIALDTHLNEELLLEGLARELVNKINTMRREMDFHVTDRIAVTLEVTERLKTAFEKHQDYITHETLSKIVHFKSCDGEIKDINGEFSKIQIEKLESNFF